jgi:hypothetical protein
VRHENAAAVSAHGLFGYVLMRVVEDWWIGVRCGTYDAVGIAVDPGTLDKAGWLPTIATALPPLAEWRAMLSSLLMMIMYGLQLQDNDMSSMRYNKGSMFCSKHSLAAGDGRNPADLPSDARSRNLRDASAARLNTDTVVETVLPGSW